MFRFDYVDFIEKFSVVDVTRKLRINETVTCVGNEMNRVVIFVMGICVALIAAPERSLAQYQCNLCDSGCSQVSPCADSSCGTLNDCGQTGGFFRQRFAGQRGMGGYSPCETGGCDQCGGGGCDQCGGGGQCGASGCGLGGGCLGNADGPVQKALGLLPSSLLGKCLDRRFGYPCGKYRNFFVGGVQLEDYEGDATVDTEGSFREGFILGYASGRQVNQNLRVEWDSSWRNNSGDIWTNNVTNNSVPFSGHFNVYTTTFNLVRDFNDCALFSRGPLVPYVGGGIGFSKQDGTFDVNANEFKLEDWAFAYQAFLGCTLWEGSRGSLYVEYRYLANTETELTANDAFFDNFLYESQNILVGVRIKR